MNPDDSLPIMLDQLSPSRSLLSFKISINLDSSPLLLKAIVNFFEHYKDLESEKTYGYGEIIVNGELYEIELIEEKLDGIVFAVYKDEKIGKLNLLVREISGEITNWDAKFEFNGNIKDFDITTKSIRLKHR